jgi:hypothetical protein
MIELTEEEQKAIRALKRLAKKWPRTLLIFASGGELSIRKPTLDGVYNVLTEVDSVEGIPNDGGDGGDIFYEKRK